MSPPTILELFDRAYRHSLVRLIEAGQQVDRGWWLLNEKDAWAFLEALTNETKAPAWKRNLYAAAQVHGVSIILTKLSIVGLPIKYIHDQATTCVLCGKTA